MAFGIALKKILIETSPLNNVGLVGTGQVARFFAQRIPNSGLNLCWIAGRDIEKAEKLAFESNTRAISLKTCSQNGADLVICAVNDNSINEVTTNLIDLLPSQVAMVHTSGSQPITTIHRYFTSTGVMYPLQTFNLQDKYSEQDIPIIIQANHRTLENQLTRMGQCMSTTVKVLNDEQRQVLHLSAVILNNFTNHLAVRAFDFLLGHNLDPKLLYPLLKKTTTMILGGQPESIQTGPARRQDSKTLNLHRNFLASAHPELLELYNQLTKSIHDYYHAHR